MNRGAWVWGVIAGWLVGQMLGGGDAALLGAAFGGFSVHLWLRVKALEATVASLQKTVRAAVVTEAPPATEPTREKSTVPPPGTSGPAPAVSDALSFDVVLPPEAPAISEIHAVTTRPSADHGRAEPLPELRWPAWMSRLLEGNPLAKIGVVLLFFGVASAFRLAVDYGWLPVSIRLGAAAAAGVGLIFFGWSRYRKAVQNEAPPARWHFAWAIQGGGFALLYLVVYFMLARYALLPKGPAFFLFALLGVVCVLLAARQNGAWLAVFGMAGAYLAPVLAGGHSATPLPLFLYLTLINALVLAVDWFRAWRVLNLVGYLLTLGVGCLWAWRGYHDGLYLVTQVFLVLFVVAYSLMPVATLLLRAPGAAAWREGFLIFGVPLSGVAMQSRLLAGQDHALALSALLAATYYLALWWALFRRANLRGQVFERAHLGIAVAFVTLAVPLAFDAQVTSAFWAAEGCAVLWFGVRNGRQLAQYTGLAMQVAAGVSFALASDDWVRSRPVFNDLLIGGLILSVAGVLCARLVQARRVVIVRPEAVLVWALAWGVGSGVAEARAFAGSLHVAAWSLAWVGALGLVMEALGQRWQWPALRHAVTMLLGGLMVAVLWQIDHFGHPLAGLLWLVVPLVGGAHVVLLVRQERELGGDVWLAPARHVGGAWLAVVVAGWELAWWGERAPTGGSLWSLLAWGLCFASALALNRIGLARGWQPWASASFWYATWVVRGVAAVAGAWALMAMVLHSGAGSGWPYVPVFNPYDAVLLAVLLSLWRSADAGGAERIVEDWKKAVGLLLFVWVTTLAARIAHHWGGVPFRFVPLWDSTVVQALVTLFWTVMAIAAMIVATRLARRPIWMAGMGLLGVVGAKLLLVDLANAGTLVWTGSLIGVALLLLAAAYLAPSPPAAARAGESSL